MENLLGLKCGLCGREFDVSPDLSTVQCPSCGRLMSTVARGLRVPESIADYQGPRDVTHKWDYDYVGEYHSARGIRYLKLCYEKTIGKYIVTFRGGNPDEGRHWDTLSPPELLSIEVDRYSQTVSFRKDKTVGGVLTPIDTATACWLCPSARASAALCRFEDQ